MSRDAVLDAYAAGVRAIRVAAGWYQPRDWRRPTPCDAWSAADLAGHLVCVVEWYHSWLDRAQDGDATPPFAREELGERNTRALERLDVDGGPERVSRFARRADAYAARLPEAWDLPYGFPGGTTTVGDHAGVAAAEWHVHAWDLSVAVGRSHTFADADVLLDARRAAGLEIRERPDPWDALLRSTGRDPLRSR